MKKTLLLGAMLFGMQYVAVAQQNISFEISEGYTTGALHSQSGWTVEGDEDGSTGTNNVIVSTERHSNGANSLKFVADEEDNAILYDVYKLITPGSTSFSITQDVFIDGLDEENGSELGIVTVDIQGGNRIPTSALFFNYTGNMSVLSSYDAVEDEYDFEDIGTFNDQTWYNITTKFNLTAGTIEYIVNGVSVHTTTLLRGQEVNAIAFNFDDYTTSFFADNILISTDVAGIDKLDAAKFSIYPNPTTGIVDITNTNNALVNKITITDINGRIMKTVAPAAAVNAQINISELSAGIYLFNVESDRGNVTKKIVKQ